jgi:tetratricopeptide (TPR) repeat protein
MNIRTTSMFPGSTLPALALAVTLSLGVSGGAAQQHQHDHHDHPAVPQDAEVPLFEGLGDHHFPITTDSEAAQAYFNQGLIFTYGFNHFEAVRSFEEAARQDETCAMCYWGVALALGPHINAPMMPDAVAPAYAATQRAQELAPGASQREQAYIEALSHRYVADPPEDRSELDRTYADAMRELVEQYPDDLDARTLFAESLMNLVPWNYWTEEGEPREETAELVDILEAVLERDPYHPGATHLYIHAMENSPQPKRAEGAADRLAELNIQIGHMIHMPGHIYARIGRWHDASTANERAIEADEIYLGAYQVEGLVPLLYHPHNVHFLAWTAGMEGRSAVATAAANDLADATPADLARELPFMQNFLIAPVLTHVRFEQWEEVLALPEPDEDAVFLRGMWHYARGRAFAEQDRLDEAREEADRLSDIAQSAEAAEMERLDAFLPGHTMLRIADATLTGMIKLRQGDEDQALESLHQAVELQDELPYFEPPYWFVSARLDLGRALLEFDRPDDAEEVYRADLEGSPQNGWALRGLAQSLEAQGKSAEAQEVAARFEEAWREAEVTFVEDSVMLNNEGAR